MEKEKENDTKVDNPQDKKVDLDDIIFKDEVVKLHSER